MNVYSGRLMSARHTGKPVENGKACEGHTSKQAYLKMSARHTGKLVENGKACEGGTKRKQAYFTTIYPYKLKSKLPKLTK